ncbi:MAG TPA: hypothetical protein VD902_15190 [Symbiobacteriaceae bacterium]|nr:hypothetical protein [Symbiobacteriaceae bacterium]
MERIWTGVLVALVGLLAATAALAHSFAIVSAVSVSGSEVTVRVMDVYGAAVEGGTASLALAPPGGKPGKAVPLTEGPPGTYRGTLTGVNPGDYDAVVDITVLGDLFRGRLRVELGSSMAETAVEMVGIDATPHFSWGPVLYGAAVVLLIAATAVAMVRRRQAVDEGE